MNGFKTMPMVSRNKTGTIKKTNLINRIGKDLVKNRFLYMLSIPGVLYFILFCYCPMFGLIVAFKEYRMDLGILGSKFIGLENFRFLFMDRKTIFQVVFNTVFLNSMFIFAGTFLAIMTAVLLNEINSKMYKKVTQTMITLPNFISWVVVAALAYNLFSVDNGIINNIFKAIHLKPIEWYNRAELWPGILVTLNAWKNVGFNSVIYLAAIAGIDTELYESAELDGANKVNQIIHITIPSISKTIIIMILLAVGRIFYSDFGMIYGLIGDNGQLFSTTEVIDTYVFRALRSLGDVGMSSAAGLLQSVVGFFTVFISNMFVKKYDRDYALF